MNKATNYRGWEYARLGEYHKNLDPNWSYTPTYIKKMDFIHNFIEKFPAKTRILDAGCGEGVLINDFLSKGYLIEGLDLNFSNEYVRRGDILNMPYSDNSFDIVFMLDVFEHLSFEDQPKALNEIKRVLHTNGFVLISIPNLTHLNSRIRFFFKGELDRTDSEKNHPGERPLKENLRILKIAGFNIEKIKGITLTVPYIYRKIICRNPKKYKWLHDFLNKLAIPSIAMLNIFICKNIK